MGAIEAQPTLAAAALAQADPKQHRIVHGMLSESNLFGLVAWNDVAKTAMVAFRGTHTIWDWIDDLDAVPVDYLPVADSGRAHMGFLLVYEHVRQSASQLLTNGCRGVQRILVTGQSLGGDRHRPRRVHAGWPMDRCSGLRREFRQADSCCYRVVNFIDVVPQVPGPPLYQHVGQEVLNLVHGGFKPLDVAYAHHLTTYLAGLRKL